MKSSQEFLVYTQRPPTGEPLWLPNGVAAAIRAKRGDRLTESQYGSRDVQELLEARRQAERTGGQML